MAQRGETPPPPPPAGPGARLDEEEDLVHLLERAEGGLDHAVVEGAFGLVEARGVEEGELRALAVVDPQDAVPGGLGARRDDGHVLAQDPVEQGGLADVGPADDGHVAGPERCFGLLGHGGDRAFESVRPAPGMEGGATPRRGA